MGTLASKSGSATPQLWPWKFALTSRRVSVLLCEMTTRSRHPAGTREPAQVWSLERVHESGKLETSHNATIRFKQMKTHAHHGTVSSVGDDVDVHTSEGYLWPITK